MIFNLKYQGNKQDFEKFILVYITGVMDCLRNNLITVDEAEHMIFRPEIEDYFKELKLDKRIQNIINKGCFLEDFESVFQHSFEKEKKEIYIRALKTIEALNNRKDKSDYIAPRFNYVGMDEEPEEEFDIE